jgi:plastocyanin
MGRSATKLAALLCCGLFALWALSAIAFAAPKPAAKHKHRSASAARCKTKAARSQKRTRGRSAACRTTATEHHSKRRAAPKSPKTSTSTATGVPSDTGAGAGTGSTSTSGASQPTSTTESGEATLPTAPPSVPHVQVTAVEYSFTLSRTTVPAGKVVFQFVNHGQDEHNLNVAPNSEAPVAGSFSNLQSQGVSDQEIELKPGTYTLFCSLPEHEKKGMKATLVVE